MSGGQGKVRRAVGAAKGTGSTVTGLVVAIVVALGVPLLWVWIASQLAGTKRDLTPSLAILITAGILVSYWVALVVGSTLRRRWVGETEEQARQRRMSWNRSFRDEPPDAASRDTDPVERLFVVVAVLAVVAFEVWFFFFAGDPLPSQPAF
jgi:multidrug efflux pump subunit AcrB